MTETPKKEAAKPTVRRIMPNGIDGVGLSAWEPMDPATLAAGKPVQSGHTYDENEARGYSVGVWHCTAFDDVPGPYPVDEYMLLLEGQVVMALPDGTEVTVDAGEAFVLPQGLNCQWKMPCNVRKIFMIVENDGRETSQNPSLVRVTKPALQTDALASDAVCGAQCVFHSADGRMQVLRRSFAQSFQGPLPNTSQRLITVLAGEARIGAETFGPKQSCLVNAADRSDWYIAAGTAWIEAQYRSYL
ncbi:MAG: cupin domain-containing protein [Pseudomonadota bacterium]